MKSHAASVAVPAPMATRVSHRAARSARCWVFDFESCACRTSETIFERYESSPVFSIRASRDPSPFRAPDEGVSLLLSNGLRFSRDQRFVDVALTTDDNAVGGDLFSRPDQNHIAGGQLGQGNLHNVPVPKHVGLAGHEPGQFLKGPGSPEDGTHLDPVSEKHDVHEGHQLPEKDFPRKAEDHSGAVEIGHRNGQGDEGHHPRGALFTSPANPLRKGHPRRERQSWTTEGARRCSRERSWKCPENCLSWERGPGQRA